MVSCSLHKTVVFLLIFLGSCRSLAVQDVELKVSRFGIIANDNDDDTKRLQVLIDKYTAMEKQVCLVFDKGVYNFSSVKMTQFVSLKGEKGTVFLRNKNQPKFSRMVHYPAKGKYAYSDNTDSKLSKISAIIFDGNLQKQGPYENYQLEHQALLFIAGATANKGRIRVDVEECSFKNSVADGISIWCNADVAISNCTAKDCFRGGITITGGHANVRVKNFKATGRLHKTGVDVEIDGKGYNGSYFTEVEMDSIYLAGDFDIGLKEGRFIGRRIYSEASPFSIVARNSEVEIFDSRFCFDSDVNSIIFPRKVSLVNCNFKYVGGRNTALKVVFSSNYHKGSDQLLEFRNCNFNAKSNINNYLLVKADILSRNNKIIVESCTFLNKSNTAIVFTKGGRAIVRNSVFQTTNALKLNSSKLRKKIYDLDIDFSNNQYLDNDILLTDIPTSRNVIKKNRNRRKEN